MYVVWGSTYLGLEEAGRTLPPLLMLAVRFGVAGPVLLALVLRPGVARPTNREWANCAVVGGCLLATCLGLVAVAEKRVPTGVSALMIAATPLWLAGIDRVWRGVRLRQAAVAGLVIGFAGVAILAWPSGGDSFDRRGIALLFLSPIVWGAGSIYGLSHRLPERPLVAAACQMTAACPILLVAAALRGEYGELGDLHPSWRSLLALAYLTTFGSLLSYSAYVWLLSNTPVSLVGTYAFVNPVVAVILGRVFLDETLGPRVLVATVVIVAAVALIVTAQARARSAELAVAEP